MSRPVPILALMVSALALFLGSRAGAQGTINVGPGQACTTIQCGINAAANGDTVLVAPGLYVENIVIQTKTITVSSSGGAAATIIDGSALGPVVTIFSDLTDNPTVSGFTIQNGGKPQPSSSTYGGIYVTGGPANIVANTVTKTFCTGILAYVANVRIFGGNNINNTLTTGCTAFEGLGSGITIVGNGTLPDSAEIATSTIEHNTASVAYSTDKGGGGAINITNAKSVTMQLNTLDNNTTTGYGGAVYVATTPSIYFINNLVYGNKGISGGLDIVVPGSSVGPLAGLLANNTITANTATSNNAGSDVYIGGNLAQYALVNNIIVGDIASQTALNCGTTYANQTITPLILDHNDIYSAIGTAIGGACTSAPTQDGNISADPQFIAGSLASVAAGTQNFRILTSSSPVVDSGNNSAPILLPLDIAGVARIQDATSLKYPVVDMGAYELAGLQDATPTSIQLSPSTYTPATGSPLTLTATLSVANSPTPTGTVTFTEDFATVGTGIISSTGIATFTIPSLTAGLHTFIAIYPGQGAFPPATSVNLLLNSSAVAGLPTTTALTSSVNPSNFGQAVTLTATITAASGTPTGEVEFLDGSSNLGVVQVDATGKATLTISTLAVGSHSLVAGYVPTGVFNGGTASLTQVVLGAASTASLTVTPLSASYGSPITATATVASAAPSSTIPTGTVNFLVDGAVSGSGSLNSGVATAIYSTLAGGPHTFGCMYLGDSVYAPSACNSASATVIAGTSALTLTSSRNPSPSLTPIAFTATLSSNGQPIAGVPVAFGGYAGLGSATTNGSGVATVAVSLPAGTYTITAAFAGSGTAASSTAQLVQVVGANPTTTVLAVSPSRAYQNQTVTLTATVTDTTGTSSPFGTVAFYDGAITLGSASTPAVSGANPVSSVTFSTNTLGLGTHALTAVYMPDANSLGSVSAAVSEVVLANTFTFSADSPSITIETEHHGSIGLHLASIGGFTAPIALSCGPSLPPVLTCEVASPLNLPVNGTASTTLTLDTDAILDFKSFVTPTQGSGGWFRPITVAILLPLGLFGVARRRKGLLLLAVLCVATVGLTSCSGKYPASTPPGTYTLNLTATGTTPGASSATTQTFALTLVVTP